MILVVLHRPTVTNLQCLRIILEHPNGLCGDLMKDSFIIK